MKREISQKDLAKYVRLVFDLPETGGRDLIPIMDGLLDHGRGSDMAGHTYWAPIMPSPNILTILGERLGIIP